MYYMLLLRYFPRFNNKLMLWKHAYTQRNLGPYSFFFTHCFCQKWEMELDEWDHTWSRVPHRTWLIEWDLPLELERDWEHDFLKSYQPIFFFTDKAYLLPKVYDRYTWKCINKLSLQRLFTYLLCLTYTYTTIYITKPNRICILHSFIN